MKDIIDQRYEQFLRKRGLDDNDKTQQIFSEFISYLDNQYDPPEALTEEESFRAYQNYRTFRKDCKTDEEVSNILDEAWQRIYLKKGFKKVSSRKSIEFIGNWIYLKRGNLYGVVYGVGPDGFGGVETSFLALEEIHTNLGAVYVLRGLVEKSTTDFDVLFTGHFFDRYTQRMELGLHIHERDKIVESFMRQEFENSLNGCGISTNETNFHCSLPTKDGLCLGHAIKTIRLFKTFVNGEQLKNRQILEALDNKAKRHQRIEEERITREEIREGPPKGIEDKLKKYITTSSLITLGL